MTEAEALQNAAAGSEAAAPPSPRKTWTTPTVFASALSNTKSGLYAYDDGAAYTNYLS